MKVRYKFIIFLTGIIFDNAFYAMEKQIVEHKNTWIRTKDKKLFEMKEHDKDQSILLSVFRDNQGLYSGALKQYPLIINLKKKDFKFFTKIVHQPSLYHSFKSKKYYKALDIAQALKAPLLYAELIQERYPATITTLIKEKYLALYHIPNIIKNALENKRASSTTSHLQNIHHTPYQGMKTYMSIEMFPDDYIEIEKEESHFKEVLTNMTLSKVLLWILFCYEKKDIKIKPCMAGYKALTWTSEELELLEMVWKFRKI